MSWQMSVIGSLVALLALGFWSYERSRPSSRMLGLVAALAALAVAGRLVLVPIPSVVATTDIALLTGYALGPAPGFAVGALAAPISNLWLGQGPWTVWQMAGWGLAGLAGAWLAMVAGRRVGRLGLACVCAAMGFAYGALLDLSVMVSFGGEQSLDRYLALSARGLPFNVAHAVGNFAIAYAAGPALVRMISRYRTRLEFRWHPAGALPLVMAGAVLAVGAAAPPSAEAAGVDSGRAWLQAAREPNGGYAATPGDRPNPQMTGWAMLGLEAAGRNPRDVGRRGATPVDFLRMRVRQIHDLGELELSILAIEGAGMNSRSFGGADLLSRLTSRQASDGSFNRQVNLTAYGVLAMSAGGASGATAGAEWLRSVQRSDGGWGFGASQRSDPDSTGAAMQALAAAGLRGPLDDAVRYLQRSQRSGGGWGLNETGAINSQSTAWAVQGLVAARVDPALVTSGGRSGLAYLAARQGGNGAYRYNPGSDQTPVWVSSQALLAITREALPIEPVARSGGGSVQPSPDPTPQAPPRPAPAANNSGGRMPGSIPAGTGAANRIPRVLGARKTPKSPNPDGQQAKGATPADGAAEPAPSAATVLAAQVAGRPSADADQGETTLYVLGGLAGLSAALGAGFLWYRRTLP